nr:hypothetical protein [Rhodococcus sp. (in: high G+C Gram-positive bacteria)]
MKFEPPVNPNYAAVITTVKAVVALKGRDRIVGLPLFGYQAIAQKGWQEGDLGVFIPAESRMSEEFAYENSLMRHAEFNKDPEAIGYLEDNRRCKAIKLGGHRSDAMFLPLDSLAYTGIAIEQLEDGDTFDTINGHEILRKYERPRAPVRDVNKKTTKKFNRVDAKFLPEHFDTLQYRRVADQLLSPDDQVVCTQKLHGTSLRVGRTIVRRKLNWLERLLLKVGVAELG